MKYKAYPEYKESCIEWIGEIPNEWEVRKLKYICSLRNEKTDDPEKEYIALEHIESKTGKLIKKENDEVTPEGESISFYKNDVLFGKLRPYLAKCLLSSFDGKCSPELLVMESKLLLNPTFLYYSVLSEWFIDVVNSSTYGAKMPRASWNFIGNMSMPLPPLPDQTAIASFLDQETAKIASILSAKIKLIEKLTEKRNAIISYTVTKGLDPNAKMTQSNIDWIGEIPDTWEVKRLKYIAKSSLMYGANEGAEGNDPESPRYIRITDIDDNGNLREETFKSLDYEKAKQYLLEDGDILFARSGATVGKTFLYQNKIGSACFAGYLIKLSLNIKKSYAKFIYYITLSDGYKSWISENTIQATIQNVNAEKYKNFEMPIPPLDQQTTIVNYLDRETARIDVIIAKTQTSIEKLKEYQTSLISAGVTGKIDVRGE